MNFEHVFNKIFDRDAINVFLNSVFNTNFSNSLRCTSARKGISQLSAVFLVKRANMHSSALRAELNLHKDRNRSLSLSALRRSAARPALSPALLHACPRAFSRGASSVVALAADVRVSRAAVRSSYAFYIKQLCCYCVTFCPTTFAQGGRRGCHLCPRVFS